MLLQGKTVLIVEDEALIALFLRQGLEAQGAAVEGPAGTLKAALAGAETTQADAAVLDINLRGETSYAAALVLARRGIPFCFVTGYAEKPLPPVLANAPLLPKPYRMEELVALLGRILTPAEAAPQRAPRLETPRADARFENPRADARAGE